MITTVNLNPCIDRSISLSDFQYGKLNRVRGSRYDASGKAINVGIVAKKLGKVVECLGFNYSEDGHLLTSALDKLQIKYEFIYIEGRLRTNTKILDIHTNIFTELNENGGRVSPKDVFVLRELIKRHSCKSNIVMIGGSVPEGVENSVYREILEDLQNLNIKTILDAEKDLLLEGIKAKPYLIKPNLYELEVTFGKKCATKKDIIDLALKIIDSGVAVVCVSMGEAGALICNSNEAFYAPGLNLHIRGFQGAGDAMVGGICVAMEDNCNLEDMLRYGMAASAASLILEGTQLCEKAGFYEFMDQIKIMPIGVR